MVRWKRSQIPLVLWTLSFGSTMIDIFYGEVELILMVPLLIHNTLFLGQSKHGVMGRHTAHKMVLHGR
jgi:hypothetical protein